ncbi:nitroreductase family deazaflavin-dependent oxidoreductase [Mycobacterium szulgai]|nr:nitroreductase family deazaflavin-dependent oxidoreductase [Mycobacterium szulgai]
MAGKHVSPGLRPGLPTLILTTTGAKSGKPCTVALLGIPHSDGVAVAAPNCGDASWDHNGVGVQSPAPRPQSAWADMVERRRRARRLEGWWFVVGVGWG